MAFIKPVKSTTKKRENENLLLVWDFDWKNLK